MSDKPQNYVTSAGLRIRRFPKLDLDDIKFDFEMKDRRNFVDTHNRIFTKILTKKENVQLEQKVIDSLINVLERTYENMPEEEAKKVAADLKCLRRAFADKLSILFDYIDKLEQTEPEQ